MVGLAQQVICCSPALQLLPASLHGVTALDYCTALFLYTMDGPYRIYSCIADPLNVDGVRSIESLRQQLPYETLPFFIPSIGTHPTASC